MNNREAIITIHMVSSLDGIIAKKDNSVEWFETPDHYEKGESFSSPEEFSKAVDCYIMGSATYEHALELSKDYGWVYGDTPTFVLTSRNLNQELPSVTFFSGDAKTLIENHLNPDWKNVWMVGGAKLTQTFIDLKLAHEIRLNILPIILGDGLRFFEYVGKEIPLHLKDSKAYQNGMVELCYEIKG
jgi:dihydrofolate reductase